MTKKKQHISEGEFQRYLENKMTDTERNAFERKLQKNPFEAEALEGMQHISTAELKADLQELKTRTTPEKRKNNFRYWAAAATFLLLVSSGILWFQLKENVSIPEVTENKTLQKEERPTVEQEKVLPEEKSQISEAAPKKEDLIRIKPSELKVADEPETVQPARAEHVENLSKKEKAARQNDSKIIVRGVESMASKNQISEFATTQQIDDQSALEQNIIRGKIISISDSQPLPGVTIIEKGTTNGIVTDMEGNFTLKLSDKNDSTFVASFIGMKTKEFHPSADSVNIIELVPDQLGLDEVVLIGYGSQKNKKTLTGSVSKVSKMKDAKVQPVEGMEVYKNYIAEKAILPDNYQQKRVVIKTLINFDEAGEIIGITNRNNSDSILFELAKEIIESGQPWNPEIKNGDAVKSQTELRIVFRKKE